ncbi:MAG: anhydro-N-acetylmuramic acid kinase [Acidobacteriota bacterium]|nr:anhydro-N-acetylmuramic acid kinase [Acidobacteriota bacterium]
MIVAGVMSGTSADGINVALVKFPRTTSAVKTSSLKIVGRLEVPYPRNVRRAVLGLMNAEQASVADVARLNFLLGELYADALLETARKFRTKIELVGCHGQTLYHQGEAGKFLGRNVAVTWQTGEASIIAARVGAPVVSDFRPADMAAGGKGAPLVPFLDYYWFRDKKLGRAVLNIGGIANLTAVSAASPSERVFAFDTGPGNMVIDATTENLFGRRYDKDGRIAASGAVLDSVVAGVLRSPFFRGSPPKTAGREEFGREFAVRFIQLCRSGNANDVIATATALTARSIADALQRLVLPRGKFQQLIVSGGGCHNPTLMKMLSQLTQPLGMSVHTSDEFGLPSDAKEAVAFALLAYQTWNRKPSNIPSATGATRSAILGKISYPWGRDYAY